MKYYELIKEEKDLLKAYEAGKLKKLKGRPTRVKLYGAYAKATLSKTRNVNLRIPEKDLLKIKAKAAEKGLPYQTLLASLVHQYSNDRVKETSPN